MESKISYILCSLQGKFTWALSFDLEQPCQVYKVYPHFIEK